MPKVSRTRARSARPAPSDDVTPAANAPVSGAPASDFGAFLQRLQDVNSPMTHDIVQRMQATVGNRHLQGQLMQMARSKAGSRGAPPPRRRNPERVRSERERVWRQRLVQRGAPLATATALAADFAHRERGVSIAVVEVFAGSLGATWDAVAIGQLIDAFRLSDGERSAQTWCGIAIRLPNEVTATAKFARIVGEWSANPLAALTTAFAANPGAAGQTIDDWVALADADAAFVDQDAQVAALARLTQWANVAQVAAFIKAGWTAANLITFLQKLVADGYAAASLNALVAVGGIGASTFALVNAGWNPTETGAFTAAVLAANIAPNDLDALLTTANMVAGLGLMIGGGWAHQALGQFTGTARALNTTAATLATLYNAANFAANAQTLVGAGWTIGNLGTFVDAALHANLSDVNLTRLLGQANFAASSADMITANWTPTHYGQFVAAARAHNLSATNLVALQQTPQFPAASQNMMAANWTPADYGEFVAAANVATLSNANLVQLQQQGGFAASSWLMMQANWTKANYALFLHHARTHGNALSAAQITTFQQTANFAANSLAMIAAGFSAQQYAQFACEAIITGTITAANLNTFQGTGGASAATAALLGTWGAVNLGHTVGHVRTRAGAPTEAELVTLLQRSQVHAFTHARVRAAATAARSGAPAWATVNAQVNHFANGTWLGAGAANGGPTEAITMHGVHPNDWGLRVQATNWLYRHVKKGHTFEYFDFAYANCTRNANITLYAPATDADNFIDPSVNDGTIRANSYNHSFNPVGNSFGPFNAMNHQVRLVNNGYNAHYNNYSIVIMQFFPLAGVAFQGRDLVAIGRLYGRTALN